MLRPELKEALKFELLVFGPLVPRANYRNNKRSLIIALNDGSL